MGCFVMRLIRLKEVMSRTGLGRTSIYNFMNAGTFPKSVQLGERAVAWVDEEIDAWILDKLERRNSIEI